jgi:hypothetical protein
LIFFSKSPCKDSILKQIIFGSQGKFTLCRILGVDYRTVGAR